ncbi:MAG: SH3 domain-containing protein [Candidatus Aegiribacteria sp.]|nr:SH3 domain-containing protein [Candidatus Aegiribacteria sp.]
MKTIRLTVFTCLLSVFVLSSCTDSRTVVPEEEYGSEPHAVWNLITVTGSVVNLRSGPGTVYTILGQVHEGDSLQVTGGVEDWYRVYIPRKSLFAWIYGPLTSGTELP